jgi:GntR family transcriptional repressor for pyruvate dehydrogenase complex
LQDTAERHDEVGHGLGSAIFRPARGHHAFESCVEQLATAIRLGVVAHGSMLPPERELAERIGVSRATVREAIAALRAADMVKTVRGRGGGTVVTYRPGVPGDGKGIADEHLAELMDALVFRRVVEPGICHVAAARVPGAEQRLMLETALREVEQADTPGLHRQADSRLHLAIASLTGSPTLIQAAAEAQASLHEMLEAIPILAVNIDHSTRQHRAIVAAILAGDPNRARRAMEQHCDDTAALLRGLLGPGPGKEGSDDPN